MKKKAGAILKKIGSRASAALKTICEGLILILDVLFLVPGMALISYGTYLIYRPAGYIIAGCCFMAMAFFIAKKQAQRR